MIVIVARSFERFAALSMTKPPSRDNEAHELPIKIPATNTSTPPTTT
jgi:hypothetical protein